MDIKTADTTSTRDSAVDLNAPTQRPISAGAEDKLVTLVTRSPLFRADALWPEVHSLGFADFTGQDVPGPLLDVGGTPLHLRSTGH
jgi:hypothetical protein